MSNSVLHFFTWDGTPSGVHNIVWMSCLACSVLGMLVNLVGCLLLWIGHAGVSVDNKSDSLAFSGFMSFVSLLPFIPTIIGQVTKLTSVLDFAAHFNWAVIVAGCAATSEMRVMCAVSKNSNCGDYDGTFVAGVVFNVIAGFMYLVPIYIHKQIIRNKDCTMPFPWGAVMGGTGPVPPVPNVSGTTTTAANMGQNPVASAYAPDSGTVLGGYGGHSNTSYGYSGNFENSGATNTGGDQNYYGGSNTGNPSQI